jgi:hypothetical protein
MSGKAINDRSMYRKDLGNAVVESLMATDYGAVDLTNATLNNPKDYSVTDGLFAIAEAIEHLSTSIREHD